MGETPNLAPDEKPVSAGALRVTCPHCGAHGEMVDMLEFVIEAQFVREAGQGFRVDMDPSPHDRAIFTCCGLWGDLAVAEPTPEDAA